MLSYQISSLYVVAASFVVTASDLRPMHVGNVLVKFADDTYVIIPAVNSDTSELSHVHDWAEMNNLKLNCQKSKEIIFTARGTRNNTAIFLSQCLGICQVRSITALGVALNDKLTAEDHVSSILTSCSSSLYDCEFSATTDCSTTYFALRFSQRYDTVPGVVGPLLG